MDPKLYHMKHPSRDMIVTVRGWLARILKRHGYVEVEVEPEPKPDNPFTQTFEGVQHEDHQD